MRMDNTKYVYERIPDACTSLIRWIEAPLECNRTRRDEANGETEFRKYNWIILLDYKYIYIFRYLQASYGIKYGDK